MTTNDESWNGPDTIGNLLLEQAARYPERDAVVVDDERLTYAQLAADALEMAYAFEANGVQPMDHVALLMPNTLDFVRSMFGAFLAGLVVVPINARYRRQELRHVIGHSDSVLLLTTDRASNEIDLQGRIVDALGDYELDSATGRLRVGAAPMLRQVYTFGRPAYDVIQPIDAFIDRHDAPHPSTAVGTPGGTSQGDDRAIVMYTSGTTALPKGCELSHRGLIRGWHAYATRIGMREGDRLWAPCPMFHMSGTGPLLASISAGATMISQQHIDPDRSLQQVREEQPTHLHPAFPQITLGLVRHPEYRPTDLRAARALLNVGPADLQYEIQSLLPPQAALVNCFGMTEASGVITMTDLTDPLDVRANSSGSALDGLDLRIVKDSRECNAGEPGEIQFRGSNALLRYYNDHEHTTLTIDEEGWVRTGDLGVVDGSGRLAFAGRMKDMLKVGGENVAPLEIESMLSTHPAVQLAQVIGKPDDRHGEVPVAFIELRPGHRCTPEELIEYSRTHVAAFKVPQDIRFVTDWPMSATKVQKFRLKELLEQPNDTLD